MRAIANLFSDSPIERNQAHSSCYTASKKAGKWLFIAESIALVATLFISGTAVPPLVLSFTSLLAFNDTLSFGFSLLVSNDTRDKIVRFAACCFSWMMIAGAICGTTGLFSANLPLFLAGIGLFAVGFAGRAVSQYLSR